MTLHEENKKRKATKILVHEKGADLRSGLDGLRHGCLPGESHLTGYLLASIGTTHMGGPKVHEQVDEVVVLRRANP